MKINFVMLLSLILSVFYFFPVKAQTPYPPPPPPLPGPDYSSNAPSGFCEDSGDTCAWGFWGKWYNTCKNCPLMTMEWGMLCLNEIGTGRDLCVEIGFEYYNGADHTLVYTANPTFTMCNRTWRILSLYWLNQWAEIRQPNSYTIKCSNLPYGVKSY